MRWSAPAPPVTFRAPRVVAPVPPIHVFSMPHSVFISYARDASRAQAVALHEALGGAAEDICFLDTEGIGIGDPFPERLVDALFDARVVVILAEPLYFTRRYCLQEFQIACGPFLRVLETSQPTAKEKEAALRGIVVALPGRGVDPTRQRHARAAGTVCHTILADPRRRGRHH